jgi:hypothetical protein
MGNFIDLIFSALDKSFNFAPQLSNSVLKLMANLYLHKYLIFRYLKIKANAKPKKQQDNYGRSKI